MAGEQKISILIVDDERSVLETYAMILEKKGFDVSTAISSVAAKQLIDQKRFDILLCDYSLEQEHTGFEVIAHARTKDDSVKCLLLTGYASLETADEAKRKNIQVLYKPIDIVQFFQTIDALMKADYEPNKDAAQEGRSEEAGSQEAEKRDKSAPRARRKQVRAAR